MALKRSSRPFLAVGRRDVSVDGHQPYLCANMTDIGGLLQTLSTVRVVFMFAGRTGTLDGFERPEEFLDTNERGLLNLLNLIRQAGSFPRVVFPSTRLVYRGDDTRSLPEEAPKQCNTVYAINKLASEAYLEMYSNVFGIPYTVMRICVPYGSSVSGSRSYGTMQHFIAKAMGGEDIAIFGDGEQRRTLIHADDLADIMLQASDREETLNRICNIGGADVLSIAQIAGKIAAKFKVAVKSVPWPASHLAIETGDTVFDDTVLREILVPKYKWTFDLWLEELSLP
jgi:UDP-glucose 4-epimerase